MEMRLSFTTETERLHEGLLQLLPMDSFSSILVLWYSLKLFRHAVSTLPNMNNFTVLFEGHLQVYFYAQYVQKWATSTLPYQCLSTVFSLVKKCSCGPSII